MARRRGAAEFLIEVTLYTGQHLQCDPEPVESIAYSRARNLCTNTMVEDAYVIDTSTGEVLHHERNAAAMWRDDFDLATHLGLPR